MKIKVTFEKEFDSNEFYGEGEDLKFDEFSSDLIDFLCEWAYDEIIPKLEFEEIQE